MIKNFEKAIDKSLKIWYIISVVNTKGGNYMFFKSISGTCYHVTDKALANEMTTRSTFKVITKEEFENWCKSRGYTADEFTVG